MTDSELHITMEEPGPNLQQQMAKIHSDRHMMMHGLELLLKYKVIPKEANTLIKEYLASVCHALITDLVNQQEEKREQDESTKVSHRNLDLAWTNQSAGFDAVDSQLSKLFGEGDKRK